MGRPDRPTRGRAGARALENQIRRRYGQGLSLSGQARSSLVSPVLVVEDDAGVRARMQGRVEHFQVLPKPVAAELLEHAVDAAV